MFKKYEIPNYLERKFLKLDLLARYTQTKNSFLINIFFTNNFTPVTQVPLRLLEAGHSLLGNLVTWNKLKIFLWNHRYNWYGRGCLKSLRHPNLSFSSVNGQCWNCLTWMNVCLSLTYPNILLLVFNLTPLSSRQWMLKKTIILT